MKRVLHTFGKICFVILCIALLGNTAKAATYTAAVSGNFTANATWGGIAPGTLLSTDIVIIPSGITVVLNSDVTFSNSSSLLVNGTLSSGSGGYALIMLGGMLSGSGNISVDSLELGTLLTFGFSGNVTATKIRSMGLNVNTGANIIAGNKLILNGGTFQITSGNLGLYSGATIVIDGGDMNVAGTGSLNLSNPYHVTYNGSGTAISAGAELSGSGLTDVTINVPSGSVILSSNIVINGMLSLSAGTLNLNGRNLTLSANADISASGSGDINSSSTSNISINTNTGISGELRFSSGGNSVNNFVLNIANMGTVNLGSSLVVHGTLNLQSGKIKLSANNLRVAVTGNVSGGSATCYVITDGNGSLILNLTAGNTAYFAVGTTAYYAPAVIIANPGSASGDLSVRVTDKVYAQGTTGLIISNTQPVVAATWHVSSSTTVNINYNLQFLWNTNMELNGFNRNNVYISHYTNGSWDAMAGTSATATGSMYMASRNGITSLSPFTVADKNANMTRINTMNNYKTIAVYPNPTSGQLHFNAEILPDRIEVYDAVGRLIKSFNEVEKGNNIFVGDLPRGYYNAIFYNEGANATAKFVKE